MLRQNQPGHNKIPRQSKPDCLLQQLRLRLYREHITCCLGVERCSSKLTYLTYDHSPTEKLTAHHSILLQDSQLAVSVSGKALPSTSIVVVDFIIRRISRSRNGHCIPYYADTTCRCISHPSIHEIFPSSLILIAFFIPHDIFGRFSQ